MNQTAGLYSAQAMVEDDDDILPWYEDQDFYFKFQTNSGTVQTSQTWDDRDYIGGNPLWQTNTTVPRTRIIPVHAELWDSDPVSSDDHFDINSTAGAYDVNFNFDTCIPRRQVRGCCPLAMKAIGARCRLTSPPPMANRSLRMM